MPTNLCLKSGSQRPGTFADGKYSAEWTKLEDDMTDQWAKERADHMVRWEEKYEWLKYWMPASVPWMERLWKEVSKDGDKRESHFEKEIAALEKKHGTRAGVARPAGESDVVSFA